MTAQGHPRSVFQRAIKRGNLLVAETLLRTEIPRPTLVDLLEVTALIAQKDRRRHQRVAARWLARYLGAEPSGRGRRSRRKPEVPDDDATFVMIRRS